MGSFARLLDVLGRPSALVGKLFAHLRVDEADRAAVVGASQRGPIVFVLRAVSAVDALAIAHLVATWKLAPIGFVHDLPALPAALLGIGASGGRRRSPATSSRDALLGALRGRETVVLFLKRAPTVFSATGRARSESDDLVQALLHHVIDSGEDVTLVPTTFFWTLSPEKLGLSPLDALFGPTDMPGDLRAAAQLLSSFQSGAVRLAELTSAREFLAGQPADAPLFALVRRLTFALLRKVERERRAALGPVRKAPDRVRHEVLRSPKLTRLIDDLSGGAEAKRRLLEGKARRMLDGLAAAPNPAMLRALEPLADWLVQRVFAGVDVEPEGIELLREAARRGTVVLLPCHKSHVDYLVLSYVLRKNLLELPMVAAGDNLSFFPVGELLKRGGAFFIRRDFKGDRLYAALVDAYVRRLLRDGWAIEFYLEGGRSRTGKLIAPKLGLLNLVVDTALTMEGRTVSFVPVHIGYERLMEDFELAQERAGAKKQRESARSLVAVADALGYDYGRVSLTFGRPIDLDALREEMGFESPALTPAKRRSITTRLSALVVRGIHEGARLTAGALVATALLDMPGRGLTHPALVARAGKLLAVGRRAGALPVAGLTHGDGRLREAAIRDAAVMYVRGGLIKEHTPDATVERSGKVPPPRTTEDVVYTVPEESRARLDLSKNGILHFFAERGLVSLSFRAFGARSVPAEQLRTDALELGLLLSHDLLSLGEGQLAERITATIEDMIAFGELSRAGDALVVGPGNVEDDAMAWLSSHGAHLTALLESQRIAARAVRLLLTESLADRDLLRQALKVGLQMFLGGEIDRREAISAPSLSAAFEAYVGRGILKRGKGRYELSPTATEAEVRALESWVMRHIVTPLSSGRLR